MKNRGQMFILMALAIAALLAISFGLYSFSDDRTPVNQRVNTMNSFLLSTEQDLSRQMYIVSYRAVLMAETSILTKGCIVHYDGANAGSCIGGSNPLSSLLNEIFFNTSSYGEICDIANQNMACGVRRVDLFDYNPDSLNKRAAELNLIVNTSNYTLTVDQTDPWRIRVRFQFNLLMSDASNIASWDKRESVESFIPIANFYDPLYIMKTNSYGDRIVQAAGANIGNMSLGYYSNNTDAPSFLARLAGNTFVSPDGNGIERFVIKTKLPQGDIRNIDKSIIDHIYFGTDNPSACQVGSETWFKLDSTHKDLYGASCT